MSDALDITEEVNNMTDSDKSNMLKKLDGVGFSKVDGITISESEIKNNSAITKSESLEVTISNILTQYNEKYGTNFKYENVYKSIISVITINSNEKEIRRLIDSQIITNMTEILTTKAILVISKVISEQLDKVARMTESTNLNAELVGMIGEIFGWIDKLEEIKNKYQLYDTDSKIKSLLKGSNTNNLVRTKEQNEALELLKKVLIK